MTTYKYSSKAFISIVLRSEYLFVEIQKFCPFRFHHCFVMALGQVRFKILKLISNLYFGDIYVWGSDDFFIGYTAQFPTFLVWRTGGGSGERGWFCAHERCFYKCSLICMCVLTHHFHRLVPGGLSRTLLRYCWKLLGKVILNFVIKCYQYILASFNWCQMLKYWWQSYTRLVTDD